MTSGIQTFHRTLDLVCTGLKSTDRHSIGFVRSIVEHGSFIKESPIDPLQWDPFCRNVLCELEVIVAPCFECKAAAHATRRMDHNSNVRVHVGTHPVSPVILEGITIKDQQLHHESSRRTSDGHNRWLLCSCGR